MTIKAAVSAAALGVVLLAACTTMGAETRIASALQASEFNDVGSQYMARPTFVSIQEFSDGDASLKVEMDEYGSGYNPLLGVNTPHVTYFGKKYVAGYLPLIDKYLEWETLASQRGDLTERTIGETKTRAGGGEMDLRFRFFSSGQSNHILIIEQCAFGTCVDKALHLNRPNAVILRSLLVDFASGKIAPTNLDGI